MDADLSPRPDRDFVLNIRVDQVLVLRRRRPGNNLPGRAMATSRDRGWTPRNTSGGFGIGFSGLPARNRQAGGAAEMGKLNPPYTVNRSVQPEIFGRLTGFAQQAHAAGIIHPTHTFRPALNYGASAAADPLRP